MGLPGSGKTTLAKELAYHFNVPHINADTLRELHDDWDFSYEGRLRQAKRMSEHWGILDFVCPKPEFIKLVNPDTIIYLDTIDESRFADTNKVFEKPQHYNLRITEWIGQNQLRNFLEDFSPGIKGIQSCLEKLITKQGKL